MGGRRECGRTGSGRFMADPSTLLRAAGALGVTIAAGVREDNWTGGQSACRWPRNMSFGAPRKPCCRCSLRLLLCFLLRCVYVRWIWLCGLAKTGNSNALPLGRSGLLRTFKWQHRKKERRRLGLRSSRVRGTFSRAPTGVCEFRTRVVNRSGTAARRFSR